jgi:hypothetical protein
MVIAGARLIGTGDCDNRHRIHLATTWVFAAKGIGDMLRNDAPVHFSADFARKLSKQEGLMPA